MNRQAGTIAGLVRGILCRSVWLGLTAVAAATPTTYTRVTGDFSNWNEPTKWTPEGYPGTDPGDTGVFSTVTGYIVAMNANQTVDSIIVTNSGSWTWRNNTTAYLLSVNNLFLYTGSGTSYFGDYFGSVNNTIAAIGGAGKVRVESGTLHLLSPQNAYSGGSEVHGGILWANGNRRLATGTYLGSGPIEIGATGEPARDAALWSSANGAQAYANPITIRSGNAGKATYGFNNLTGTSSAGQSVTHNGGITLQKDLTVANDFTDRAPLGSGQLQIQTIGISGTGHVTKDGVGVVRFLAANSYTGDTIVQRGILTFQNAGNSNTGAIRVKGGLLMTISEAALGNAANTLTLGETGSFGRFGPYDNAQSFTRSITLAGNGGFLHSLYGGSYSQAGGLITGPGKLILSINPSAKLSNNNDYAGGTVVVEGTVDNVSGLADNNTLFGTGDLAVLFQGRLLLRGNNVASGKQILVTRTGSRSVGVQAALALYAGVTTAPALHPDSSGILLLNAADNSVFNDLVKTSSPQLGDGYMTISSSSSAYTFTGSSLQANLDDVYRLGALGGALSLNSPDAVGVLTGARSVEIGQVVETSSQSVQAQIIRQGTVRTYDANDYTGSTTVYQYSLLQGDAQTGAGESPFGDANGAVVLRGGGIQLVSASGGQGVSKGTLTYSGDATVTLGSAHAGNRMTFDSLNRQNKGVLFVSHNNQSFLGSANAKVFVTNDEPVPSNNMLAPYFLNPLGWFLDYTSANGFTNATYSHTSLSGVDASSIVNTAGGTVSGTVDVRAIRTTGALTGGAGDTLLVHSGGMILSYNGTHTAPISFGAEGVIYDSGDGNVQSSTLSGILSGSSGFIKSGYGRTILNANNSTTLSGPITINNGVLRLAVVGALASASPITLNGGTLESGVAQTIANPIELGPLGGTLGATAANAEFSGDITGGAGTGPLCLYGNTVYVTISGVNTYSGGTVIGRNSSRRIYVAANSSLGSGDVTVDGYGNAGGNNAATTLALYGAGNISPTARVLLVGSGCYIAFWSVNPSIGSLEGNGEVKLGPTSDAYNQTANARLTVGGNNLNTEFFGRLTDQAGALSGGQLTRNQLIKVGTGNLTLWGDNHFRGGTTISNGTLTVNNWINPEGGVTIEADGTLDGIGTVGAVVNNGGTIRGSVQMASLTLGGGSTIEAVLNGDDPITGYSQLNLPGAVDLNNATLQVSLGFAPAMSQSFTILSAGSLTGQLANAGTILAMYDGKSYLFGTAVEGNSVVLTVLPQGSLISIR